jgi:DNA-binding transcriptional LysR family regulator
MFDVQDCHDASLPSLKLFARWNIEIQYIHRVNLSSVDLNLLVVLDALLAEGSVTAAAKRVRLSQPALSNALARLRHAIGDPLFVRSGRSLVATPRARELAVPVRRALADLSLALSPPSDFEPTRAQQTFTLMMPDIAELVLVPPLLQRLRREAPGIEVRIAPSSPATVAETLASPNPPDLIITMLGDQSRGAAVSSPLFALEFVCLVRRKHPRVGKRLSLARFLELEHLLVAPGGSQRGLIDELLESRGHKRRVVLTLAHFFTAAMVVSRTDLVMSATSVLAAVAEQILPVRSVRHPLGTPSVTIAQLWHPSRNEDRALAWLRGIIAEIARTVARAKR